MNFYISGDSLDQEDIIKTRWMAEPSTNRLNQFDLVITFIVLSLYLNMLLMSLLLAGWPSLVKAIG